MKIALIQTPIVWEDRDANLSQFTRLVRMVEAGCDIILLPEMFTTGFSMHPERYTEKAGGPGHRWMYEMARETGAVIAGSLMVQDRGFNYNRFIWMPPEGEMSTYDKRHLFRMGDETARFIAGRERVVFTTRGWRILPMVCYDLRFPVWSMNKRIGDRFEYDLILYTANWPSRRIVHWRKLLQSRAIENQAYVAGVNRTGHDGNGVEHDGNSLIIDPLGEILADAGKETERILYADLDKRFLDNYRERFGVSLDWDKFDIRD